MNLDPALGIKCIMTIFGLTYKGHKDPEDNGIGAFENLQTGTLYRTANESILGVSIPIPFYEQTPNMSRHDIESKAVTCTIEDSQGNLFTDIPVVDLGPGKDGYLIKSDDGPHLLDRSWLVCHLMSLKANPMDNVEATYWLIKDGVAYDIKGRDTPYISLD